MLDHALVIGAALETVQGRIGTAAEQGEVRRHGRRDPQRAELFGTRVEVRKLVSGHQQIDKRSPERRDELRCRLSHSGLA